jgi:hypothetical protein
MKWILFPFWLTYMLLIWLPIRLVYLACMIVEDNLVRPAFEIHKYGSFEEYLEDRRKDSGEDR